MFSDRIYKVASFFVPKLAKLGACKYTWDQTSNIFVKLPRHKSNDKITTFVLVFLVVWDIFHVLQLARFFYINDLSTVVFLITCAIALNCAIIVYTLSVVWCDEVYPTINSIIIYLRWINCK